MEMVDDSPEICDVEVAVDVAKVKELKVGQYVALTVKVLSLKPVTQVRASFGKICENEDVNKVSEGASYNLRGGIVKMFDGEKYVSMLSKCCVERVEDIGEVSQSSQVVSSGLLSETMIGEIIGCSVTDKYRSFIL